MTTKQKPAAKATGTRVTLAQITVSRAQANAKPAPKPAAKPKANAKAKPLSYREAMEYADGKAAIKPGVSTTTKAKPRSMKELSARWNAEHPERRS
jgi:hypothetical protein